MQGKFRPKLKKPGRENERKFTMKMWKKIRVREGTVKSAMLFVNSMTKASMCGYVGLMGKVMPQ